MTLATLLTRALVLAGLAWCLWVAAQAVALWVRALLDDPEGVGDVDEEEDDTVAWDRAHDQWIDGQMGLV